MNKVILMGRLTRDIEMRYTAGENPMAVARYTLAVPRRFKREGEPDADFVSCVAFGKTAEFAGKYFRQGTKIVITGRIQTGSYTNRDGRKVYTTDVVVEDQESAESKSASELNSGLSAAGPEDNTVMNNMEAKVREGTNIAKTSKGKNNNISSNHFLLTMMGS